MTFEEIENIRKLKVKLVGYKKESNHNLKTKDTFIENHLNNQNHQNLLSGTKNGNGSKMNFISKMKACKYNFYLYFWNSKPANLRRKRKLY